LVSNQGVSKIILRSSNGTEREVARTYYWKNADGALPGDGADLYESHRMQEIAVSIPTSEAGIGSLYVIVNGIVSNTLPFTVRSGNIYFVHPSGSNTNNCSWSAPCEFIDGGHSSPGHANALANGRLAAGDTVHSRGVTEPGACGGGNCSRLFVRGVDGTKASPVSFVS
jgi:hypothetical protein